MWKGDGGTYRGGVLAEIVEGYGYDDDVAGDDFLDVGGEADRFGDPIVKEMGDGHLRAAVGDDRHNQRSDDGAEDGAFAAVERARADDAGGDDIEFEADIGGGAALGWRAYCMMPAVPAKKPPNT